MFRTQLTFEGKEAEDFDKIYTQIYATVQANRLDEANSMMDKLDTITKQRIVDRMIKENPTN